LGGRMIADKTWRSVGSAAREQGRRSEGFLELGRYPDGPLGTPVVIIAGRKPGPTVWMQACVHGTEVGGIVGLHRFLDGIDPERLAGTIVAIPAANPLALRAQTRNTPYDGENLNRVFPGSLRGSHSIQVAARLLETALGVADVIVDLHSGGDRSHVPFYGIHWADGSAAASRAGEIVRAADVPCVWAATDSWLSGSMMAQATQRGIPAVIIECGGAGQVPEDHVASFARALSSMCAFLDMIPGHPVHRAEIIIDRCTLVYNETGGLFEPLVAAGTVVEAGQPIGRVTDLRGHLAETIHASVGPAYIAAIRKAWAAVPSGEMIAECVLMQTSPSGAGDNPAYRIVVA
jgi:predicted deacylase